MLLVATLGLGAVDDAAGATLEPVSDPLADAGDTLPATAVTTSVPVLCDGCGLITDERGVSVDGPAGLDASTGSHESSGSGSTPSTSPPVSTPVATVAGFSLVALLAAVAYKLRWLSGLILLAPLFSRIRDDDVLKHPLRAELTEFVRANPGAPVKDIQDTLGAAHGTVIYHLALLEKRGILVSQQDGTMRRYWTEDDPAARRRKPAVLLARPAYRQIARFVADHPGINQTALCDALGMRKPAASKRLRRLQDEGLVSSQRQSRNRHYWAEAPLDQLLGQPRQAAVTA